jgi:hypothetical protein
MEKKKKSKRWKLVIQALPIAAGAGTTFLPLQRLGQQFTMLIVLVWLQVFFVIECFMANK